MSATKFAVMEYLLLNGAVAMSILRSNFPDSDDVFYDLLKDDMIETERADSQSRDADRFYLEVHRKVKND